MTTIKTAISIQRALFEQVDTIAREMKVSRSQLFVLAIEEFMRRYENQRLLEKIDAAYADLPDVAEDLRLDKVRQLHRRLVEGEW